MAETSAPPPPQRSILATIFTSPNEPRLRAGWRLCIHVILFLFLVFVFEAPLGIGLTALGIDLESGIGFAFNELGIFLAITTASFLARRLIDRRSITSLGLALNPRALYDLLAGILVACVLMGGIFATEMALGWARIDQFAWQTESAAGVAGNLLLWLVAFALGGWSEELLSRGYQLQNLEDGMNLFWAVLISSSVFGFLHLNNPGASWISTTGIVLAGLFLALPYVLTRQLWMSIGLHLGWNFFEGTVFGFPVSGLDTYHLIHQTSSGPELWTGSVFGPEAGLILVPALLLGSALIYVYARRIRPLQTLDR